MLAAAGLPRGAGADADADTRPDQEPAAGWCAPLEHDGDGLPDLQGLAHGVCRALFDGEEAHRSPLAARLRVRVGGWADASYLDNDLSDGDPSFDLDNANLHLDVRLDESLQLFFEGEYDHERDLTGLPDERELELEQGFFQYSHSDALKVRAGRFANPFGYWTPVHWSVNVDTIEPPIHEESRMIPEQQVGGELHGRLFPRLAGALEPAVEYALALGYGGDGLDTGKPEGLTAGGDLRLWSAERHFLGASWYMQENSEIGDRDEQNLMLYGQLDLPANLLFRSEYLHQWRSKRPGYTRDADVVYAKLRWSFHPKAYGNYRFQFGQDDRYGFTTDHVIHTITLGYRPVPRVITKIETAFHDLESIESYVSWGASLGVVF